MLRIIVFMFTAGVGICLAQADRAAVTGTVRDPSHSGMPGAQVKLIYPGTGLQRETTASSAGVFLHRRVTVGGKCVLEVSAHGFQTVRTKSFVLQVGETRNLDVSLEVSGVSSSVEVQAVADPMTLSTEAVDSLTSSQRLNDLPVNGRNWMSFMALAPGAVDGANGSNTGVRFFYHWRR